MIKDLDEAFLIATSFDEKEALSKLKLKALEIWQLEQRPVIWAKVTCYVRKSYGVFDEQIQIELDEEMLSKVYPKTVKTYGNWVVGKSYLGEDFIGYSEFDDITEEDYEHLKNEIFRRLTLPSGDKLTIAEYNRKSLVLLNGEPLSY